MKISLISLCRNEAPLVPYYIDHYENIVDEIIVFDNESTDGCDELLKQCPKVRVISYCTNGYFKEEMLTFIRNYAFRQMGSFISFTKRKSPSWARIQPVISGKRWPCSRQRSTASRSFFVYRKNSLCRMMPLGPPSFASRLKRPTI